MHIVFINYSRFADSSGIHIHFLANQFQKLGIRCTVLIPESQPVPEIFGVPLYQFVTFDEAGDLSFANRRGMRPDETLLYAWTPRENVRQFTLELHNRLGVPYFVHMEDNEELILSTELGIPYREILKLPDSDVAIDKLPPAMIRPHSYERFLRKAKGVTCIFQTLETFVPDGTPRLTFWPACEPDFFELRPEPDLQTRNTLGIDADTHVISYTGNMHKCNVEEVTTIYLAVEQLNKNGLSVKLIRSGSNTCPFATDVSAIQAAHVLELGSRSAAELKAYVSAADILVQPGSADEFNNYRFPSKLPMFLASGRPVILPPANIGKYLVDGKNCLLIRNGTADELAGKISQLLQNHSLRKRIGTAGREFAKNNFSWERSARRLLGFYRQPQRTERLNKLWRLLGMGRRV